MKKRLLSALLALALVFVLLPTTALADTTPVTDENVKINGTAVIVGNDISLGEGNGTYSYDKATHTLTLNSATINATGNIGISFGVPVKRNIDYKIELIGTNTISSTSAQAIYVEYDSDLDQQGTQKLSTLTINGSAGSQLILNASGYEKEAIWSKGDFTLSGGTAVTAFSSGTIAVNVGSMTINNSKLSAQSSSYGTTVVLYGFEMIGDAAEFEALNTSSGVRAVLRTSGASENIDWSKYQLITGSYSGNALTKSEPTVCDKNTLNGLFSSSSTTRYIHIAKRTIPALETTSDVLIAGKDAVVGVETSIPSANGSGTYFYDQASKTLTLENVNITSVINAIQFAANGDYTIRLEGENKISNVSNGIFVTDDKYITSLNVTITGTGSLDISAKGLAINMKKGDLKFENTGEIKLTTSNISPTHNVLSVSGNISIADMEKYKVEGIVQDNTEDGGDTVTLSEASHLKGYQNPGDTQKTCLKSITIASKPSETYYNGTAMKYGETRTVGSGTISCDEKGVITLNGVTEGTLVFRSSSDSTLVLEGTNTLSSIVTTQKGLTISGSGSLTAGSIKVTNDTRYTANLTITDGAKVTAGTTTSDAKAIDITGNLTVNSGATLTATNTSETNPTIDVSGNVTISGDPGTNAYTVSAHNSCDVQKDRVGNLSPSGVPSAIKIGGTLNISAGARVMAQTDSYGAGVMLGQNSTITVEDASLSAQNSSCDFAAISFSGYMGDIYVSGAKGEIVAENTHTGTNLRFRAINAFVYNRNTDFYLKMQSEGVIEEAKNKIIAPDGHDASGGKKVTITRGDAYTTPQVAANYTIAGQTMYVGKYYKTDANGNITDGTAQDYNIYCDSKNDFTLNNATISSTGTGGSTGVIMTNLNYSSAQFHIKLIGTNSINNAGHHAILGEGAYSTIIIENAENASNASLTISGNFLPVYFFGNVTINAEVVIKNTNGNLISTIKDGNANGAFDLGSGYKCYASTSTTGTPLEEFNSANYSTYKYLRVTTQTLETGGGSTHEHVWDEAWHDTGDYHHAHQCTICKAYDTTTQESHNVTGHRDNHDGSHSNICGSCGYSAKVSHSYTWAPNANDNEKHIGTCVCGNVVERYHNFVGDVCSDCGYDKSTGTTCEHVWTTEWTIDTVDNEYHWHKCIKCNAITDKKPHAYTIVTDSGTNHIRECECKVFYVEDHISSDWIIDTPATATTAGSKHKECTVCKHEMQTEVIPATGEIEPPTPDNPGTIVIIRPAEEEKPAQQPNPSTGANDLVGMAVAAAVVAVLGSVALLRKHD